eukprot:scaffold16649_cov29-Attheya_sp.AAC.1
MLNTRTNVEYVIPAMRCWWRHWSCCEVIVDTRGCYARSRCCPILCAACLVSSVNFQSMQLVAINWCVFVPDLRK